MAFSPQPALVSAALDVFCKQAAIEGDSYEYNVAHRLIQSLYDKGANTSETLVAAIECCAAQTNATSHAVQKRY